MSHHSPQERTQTARRPELIVRLDEPFDGSSRFLGRIQVRGWLLIPKDSGDPPGVSLLLEEHRSDQSSLSAGMLLLADALPVGPTAHGTAIERLSVTRADVGVDDPDEVVSGVTYSFEGTIDLSAILPPDGEAPRLLSLSALCRVGSRTGVSNRVTFTLAAESARKERYGGFVETLPRELYSDFLVVQAWALCEGDSLVETTVLVNGRRAGTAEQFLESPRQYRALPDIDGASHCMLSAVLRHDDLARAGLGEAERSEALSISLECRFESGAVKVIEGVSCRWRPEPLGAACAPALCGAVESVARTAGGEIAVEGWMLGSDPAALKLLLTWKHARLELGGGNGNAPLLRTVRDDLTRSYPTLGSAEPPGFKAILHPSVFGAAPGLIKIAAFDAERDRSAELGPPGMWRAFSELIDAAACSRGMSTVASRTARLLDPLLRIGAAQGARPGAGALPSMGLRAEPRGARPRVLICSHNLSPVEGAPRVLYDVVRFIAGQKLEPSQLLVVGARHGGLSEELAALGVETVVIEALDIVEQTWERYLEGISQVGALARRFGADAVYANALDCFWAIDLARRLEIPALWAIHESVEPKRTYHLLDTRLRLRYLHALAYAESFIFVSERTALLYGEFVPEAKRTIIPNAVDLDAIDAKRAAVPRGEARRTLGLEPDQIAISIVGTTTRRKGQDIFLREAAILRRRRPEERLVFFIVGAREIPFLAELRELAADLDIEQHVVFVPEQPDITRFFVASDVLTICSREESAPLVSLEAFAYEVPLVSTTVFGLAEQIYHDHTALSFDAEVEGQLAERWERLLDDPGLGPRLTHAARAMVAERFQPEQTWERYWLELSRRLPEPTVLP